MHGLRIISERARRKTATMRRKRKKTEQMGSCTAATKHPQPYWAPLLWHSEVNYHKHKTELQVLLNEEENNQTYPIQLRGTVEQKTLLWGRTSSKSFASKLRTLQPTQILKVDAKRGIQAIELERLLHNFIIIITFIPKYKLMSIFYNLKLG